MPSEGESEIPGFRAERHLIGDTTYLASSGGDGPPVLLLHGFPETHRCWRHVAPVLAESRRIVAPDLRGYGGSSAPPGGPQGEGYTKREMATEMVELMRAMGHDRFAVVGHDRGARVAYRLALDHPANVTRLAVLNIVTTIDQFEAMGDGPSLGYWPWFLLAQPAPFPEELLSASAEAVLAHVFSTWAGRRTAIDDATYQHYLRSLTRHAVEAICADYRASFYVDRHHDLEDRLSGRHITAPMLVVTGEEEHQLADASYRWASWSDDVTAVVVSGGHFVPEESPAELTQQLDSFLS